MRKFLTPLFAFLIAPGAQAIELNPATATYSVTRDGKAFGDATYTLAANGDGTWTLSSVMRGTAGIARMAGLDVREESVFRWHNGKAEGVRYDYTQASTLKHKQRRINFDNTAGQAQVQDGKDNFSYAIPTGTVDRSTVALALGEALASGTRDITLPVAVKDHVEQQHFVANTEESIQVPAGTFKAIKFERVDVPGKATSWYASSMATLPVRVEQAEGDGSKIVLELKSR